MIPRQYLGAFKAGHRRPSREFVDEEFSYDLLKKAQSGCPESRAALEYLTKFNNEYHKNVIKKGDASALHCTDDLRRDCYQRDNCRRRDVMAQTETFLYHDDLEEVRTFDEEDEFEPLKFTTSK